MGPFISGADHACELFCSMYVAAERMCRSLDFIVWQVGGAGDVSARVVDSFYMQQRAGCFIASSLKKTGVKCLTSRRGFQASEE